MPTMPAPHRSSAVLLLLTAMIAPAARAQPPSQTASTADRSGAQEHTIHVDVSRVVLNVTVRTKKGQLIPGLQAGDFLVFEDGARQELLSFAATERPLSLAFVFDSSRSMRTQQAEAISGVVKLAMSSNPEDHRSAVAFADGVTPIGDSEPSLTHIELRDRLMTLHPDGMTSLYDGISEALRQVERSPHQRQALVVFSDGGDTASELSLPDLLDQIRRSNALVYTIGLSDYENPYRSPGILRKLAAISGGAAFFPRSREELMQTCEKIAVEIRSQYTLSYSPTNTDSSNEFRRISVRLQPGVARKALVRTREGYFPHP